MGGTKTKGYDNSNPMPAVTEAERQALQDDIAQNGFMYPVVKSAGPWGKGLIIDGFTRIEIGKSLGMEPPVREIEVYSEAEFRGLQISANIQRRQLTPFMRAEYAHKLFPLQKAAAEARVKAGKPLAHADQGGRSIVAAGSAVGLKSRRFLEEAFRVIESRDEELIEKVRKENLTVHEASKIVKQRQGLDPKTVLATRVASRIGERLPAGRFAAVVITPQMRSQVTKFEKGRLMPNEIETIKVPGILAANAVVAIIVRRRWRRATEDVLLAWGASEIIGEIVWTLNEPTQEALAERNLYIVLGAFGKRPAPTRQTDSILGGTGRKVPPQLLNLLDEWFPDAAGLVMFGETDRAGWTSWAPSID